jgi:hypothetical protein
MFLGLLDPDPDPLVRGMDPDLDPSLDFLSSKTDVNLPSKSNKQNNFFFKLDFCWRLEGQ